MLIESHGAVVAVAVGGCQSPWLGGCRYRSHWTPGVSLTNGPARPGQMRVSVAHCVAEIPEYLDSDGEHPDVRVAGGGQAGVGGSGSFESRRIASGPL
jgi:hypothetical protein